MDDTPNQIAPHPEPKRPLGQRVGNNLRSFAKAFTTKFATKRTPLNMPANTKL